MLAASTFNRALIRSVRRRAQRPIEFIEDATTFSDTHTVINDPYSPLPYPQKQLFGFLNKQTNQVENEKMSKMARVQKSEKLKSALNFDHIPIEKQIFVLLPGQGEQHIGMGEKLKTHRASMEIYENASSILNYDVWDLCQSGPKSKLDQTVYSHTALFVNTMAAMEKLKSEVEEFDERLTEVAGFGVGEFAALVLAGVLKFEDALKLVDTQARLINECNQLVSCSTFAVKVNASSQLDTAMNAVRNAAIERGEMPLCEVAGYLYCGMKILGASHMCKMLLTQDSEQNNFTVGKALSVIGAPYTGLMRPAEASMIEAVKSVEFGTARLNVYSNYLGKSYPRKKALIRQCIFKQFSNPIKFEQIMQLLYRKHQDYKFPLFYELGASKQLRMSLFQTSKKAHDRYVNYPC